MNARLFLPALFLLAGQVVAQSNPFAESAAKREAARLRDADRATIATQRARQEIEKIGAIAVPRPVLEPGVVNIDAPVDWHIYRKVMQEAKASKNSLRQNANEDFLDVDGQQQSNAEADVTQLYSELSHPGSGFARRYAFLTTYFTTHNTPVAQHPRRAVLIAHMVSYELKGSAPRDSVQQVREDLIQGRLRQVAEMTRQQNEAKAAVKQAISEAFRRVELEGDSLKLGNGRSLQGTRGINGSLSFHLSPMELTNISPDVATLGLTHLNADFDLSPGSTSFTAPGSGTLILRDNGGGAYTADQ
jgi:hypothetical protein